MTIAQQDQGTPLRPRDAWPRLMAAAQQGDSRAYRQLLSELVPVIRTLTRRQTRDETLIEDIIQDVLITVHRVRHTYDPGCPFLPWLMAIVSARAIDALRQRSRAQRWQPQTSAEAEPRAARHDEPAFARARQDTRKELNQILAQLPLRQREVVEDVHLREMSLADVASKSQLSVAAVKSLLHRALTTLRRYGEKHDRSS